MKICLKKYHLAFIKPFALAHGIRTGTEALFLSITNNGQVGYAEATFPPYLNETVENSQKQIELIDFTKLNLEEPHFLKRIDAYKLTPFTRALVINCIYDLKAKENNQSLAEYLEIPQLNIPYKSSLTITKSDLPELSDKLELINSFSILKLKLNGENDLQFVNNVLNAVQKPFCVDINQGWENKSLSEAVSLAKELKMLGCELIEQPFIKSSFEKHKNLVDKGIIDIYADESIQNLEDLENFSNAFNGVNIKILKCGGIDQALLMVKKSKTLNKKIIIGCMSESSCGCATAFALNSFANYLDIDGPWLIKNNPFSGFSITKGRFETISQVGIGVTPISDFF